MKTATAANIAILAILAVCAPHDAAHAASKEGRSMEVTSPAFPMGGMIPPEYSCTGRNISPPLAWTGMPEGTRSIAIIADDPDAPRGTWVHWVYYDIPAHVRALPPQVPRVARPPAGGIQGVNDSRNPGYDGPCPPSGTHRYYFKVYALDRTLVLPPGAAKKDVLKAMEGHILGEGMLMGRFRK